MQSHLCIFAVVACVFGVISKKSFPNPMSWRFFPMFCFVLFCLFQNWIVSSLMFSSLIYFSYFFVYGVTQGPTSLYYMWLLFSFPNTFCSRERISFVYYWQPCQRAFDHKSEGLFLSFLVCSIGLCIVFIPVPQCFNYCRFVICFEFRNCDD